MSAFKCGLKFVAEAAFLALILVVGSAHAAGPVDHGGVNKAASELARTAKLNAGRIGAISA